MKRSSIEASIDLAADYLARACGPDGRFVYKVNLDPAVEPNRRYNVLRHAGAVYALAKHRARRADPDVAAALTRAARFLHERCIAPMPEGDALAVWSRPELTGAGEHVQAKLGGAGLALVALIGQDRVQAGSTPLETLQGLGHFIRLMQKADGSFYSKYVPARGGFEDRWTSLYYPGEAALGLAMLHELDPSSHWLDAAVRTLGYLARIREGEDTVPADHWALLATSKLLSLPSRASLPVPRDVLVRHGEQVVESILREQVWDGDDPAHAGGFAEDGRTTPTATRLEGLLAALAFIPTEHDELRFRVRASVREGIAFLLLSQVREGEHAGGIPRAVKLLPPDGTSRRRSFNRRATEIRIDYVQHAMCACMQYCDIPDGHDGAPA